MTTGSKDIRKTNTESRRRFRRRKCGTEAGIERAGLGADDHMSGWRNVNGGDWFLID